MKIKAVDIPPNAMILKSFKTMDYADAYRTTYRFERTISLEETVPSFFLSFPFWVLWLMKLRNAVVSIFSLKKPDGNAVFDEIERFKGEIGESISLFRVYDKKTNEIMTGVDDKHLHFRVSFFLDPDVNNSSNLTVATVVQFNNWLGKIYFLPVRFFHKLIIPEILRKMITHLNQPSNSMN